MKGYKAFGKGLICKGKQYAENTVFEEKKAEICHSGMHFCKNPLDCLDYYPLIDDDGDLTEFAEVEALGNCLTDDNKKRCTKKLKVGAKIDLPSFIKASFEFIFEKCNIINNDDVMASSGSDSQLASSGCHSKLASSGYDSQLASSGSDSQLASSGDYSKLASSGDYSQLASSGYGSKLASSGYDSQLASSGCRSQLASSGDYSKLASSGCHSKLASSGDYSQLASSGYGSKLALRGKNSVGANIGINGKIKGLKGSWITLAEYDNGTCICVKSAKITGRMLKENVWYKLKDGKFIEA